MRRRLAILLALVLVLASWPLQAQSPKGMPRDKVPATEEPGPAPQGPPSLAREAQAISSLGSTRKDVHGPFRNDPAEGIPVHAYSPFDERNNREHPCPPGGCESQKGQVLIKLAPDVQLKGPSLQGSAALGAWTTQSALNTALTAQGVVRLEALFPKAQAPKLGAMIESPLGERLPMPDLTRWFRARLADPKADAEQAAIALGKAPGVAWAEPDYLRKPVGEPDAPTSRDVGSPSPSLPLPAAEGRGTLALPITVGEGRGEGLASDPNDPLYAQQWHLAATNVPQAWAYLESQGLPPGGNRDIVVAVIDTGVDLNHPDLAANLWTNSREIPGNGVDDDANGYVDDVHGADMITNSGSPMDDHGHGTHVAGIIAAQANNALGGVGVAYNTQIMALKAAQYSGVLAVSDIAEAVYYAVTQGADVINMSFGGYARSQVEEDALTVAFGQAVLVAAAGNDGKVNLPCPLGRDMYPAAYNWVLGVMASTQSGGKAGFSNYDCTPHDTHEYELMAPGVDVWSTLPNAQYAAWDGTSMAAPVVAGIAALARTKWADKDVYSSRFIMGQIASNAAPVADAHASLTVSPEPELRYLQHWLFDTVAQSATNDADGIVDAGETVDLAIVIRNHWGKADPVTVTLEAWAEGAFQPDPYVAMITDTVNYGAIGSFNWDDNGLIYDSQGAITGVQHPFRFTVPITTPNDHVIPFRLTMAAFNGLDPSDMTIYYFVSRFYLLVQRGRELPAIIDYDMILTRDEYWIIPQQTLIEAGVSVTITAGAQVQFGSTTPSSPYDESSDPFLQVEGAFQGIGTLEEPIEMFGSPVIGKRRAQIRNLGTSNVRYAKITNPILGVKCRYGACDDSVSLTLLDHIYVQTDRPMSETDDRWAISAGRLANSILHRMQGKSNDARHGLFGQQMAIETTLVDAPSVASGGDYYIWVPYSPDYGGIRGPISGTVFLQDNGNNSRVLWRFHRGPLVLPYAYNAFLSKLWEADPSHWMRFEAYNSTSRSDEFPLTSNYWGTTSDTLIEAMIHDYNDDFNIGRIQYQPILTTPVTTTYPFVWDVVLSTASDPDASVVGAEPVTFTVTFNRDMDPAVEPQVSFGPDVPETDYTIHPINGGWQDARTWAGTFNITPITGDGYQLIRVAGAVAADDPWLVTGDDAGRFRFEVITSGTEAMNLQATGGEGYVDLMWSQDDFDLLAGYNLYRSTTLAGTYSRINASLVPPGQHTWRDSNVTPGQPYYYKFTVVKSDMSESDYSNVATATPIDTIPPVIAHTPVPSAQAGLPLSLNADVSDNVGVQGVTLYHRHMGDSTYASRAMAHTTGNRYVATLEGALLSSPGIEYYIEATDGVGTARHGRADYPHQVTVVDKPVVTSISPVRGPAAGGNLLTIAGSNFHAGASVTLGGAVASGVSVLSSSQITCSAPAHFPETVDVRVTNPDAQSGTLLRGYTYESEEAAVGLPAANGGQHDIVQIPILAANVQGLAAADVVVTFDPAVLAAQGASVGTLTPGWSLAANTSTPGSVRLSMASPGGSTSGAGTLALIECEVLGAPGLTSTLHLVSASLNDGAIPVSLADGSFVVDSVYTISGRVSYWNGGSGVPGALLTAQSDRTYTDTTDSGGAYAIGSLRSGNYTLTPSKGDEANGISSLDASLALRHAAGISTLSGHAATAADVNRSGIISSMDAFYILQKSVELITLPFPGAGAIWLFDPSSRTYTGLSSDQPNQDHAAILLGDPTGNWVAGGGGGGQGPQLRSASATLSWPQVATLPGAELSVPLCITVTEGEAYGIDLVLSYDPAVLTATSVAKGSLATSWSIASNLGTPGSVRVALAGSSPIVSAGELLNVVFHTVGSAGQHSDLTLTQVQVNEGAIPTVLQNGRVTVYQPVQAAFSAAPTSGVASLAVTFTNQSTGDYASSQWAFGDGDTSAEDSPVHTYQEAGDYTVSLTVSGLGGTDTLTRSAYINVRTCAISGTVSYWHNSAPIPGVTLTLSSSQTRTVQSVADGSYAFDGLKTGDYALTPSKADGVKGLSAYDASLVLQHAVGLISLAGHQGTAADVNQSGSISAMDASYILQRAVGLIELPFPGAGAIWLFDPASRTYPGLVSDQTGQDFTAVLLGDVSGNWASAGGGGAVAGNGPVRVWLVAGPLGTDGTLRVGLWMDSGVAGIQSVDVRLAYSRDLGSVFAIELGALSAGMAGASNVSTPGEVRLALAGVTPTSGRGEIAAFTFKPAAARLQGTLSLASCVLDEGAQSALCGDLRLGETMLFLPMAVMPSEGE